jgi:hypothetical protein
MNETIRKLGLCMTTITLITGAPSLSKLRTYNCRFSSLFKSSRIHNFAELSDCSVVRSYSLRTGLGKHTHLQFAMIKSWGTVAQQNLDMPIFASVAAIIKPFHSLTEANPHTARIAMPLFAYLMVEWRRLRVGGSNS